jgi:hypothetical protein
MVIFRTGFAGFTTMARPSRATTISWRSFSSGLRSREDIPISQAAALQAWMPALDPPPWTLTAMPGCRSWKTSAHLSAKGWTLVEPATVTVFLARAPRQAQNPARPQRTRQTATGRDIRGSRIRSFFVFRRKPDYT